ncbi:unnamed protein product [Orchesella dallaii]|uniref:GH16 domain-containing protein n=1 Tax=Orchesella dallaii TaxID=48710 RepID=A0ABP1SAM3_9HEXA
MSIHTKLNKWGFILCVVLVHCIEFGNGAKRKSWDGKLIFEENFNGERLGRNWEIVGNCEGKGHKDINLECFTTREDNVRLRDGILIIEAWPEVWHPKELWAKSKNFTSGKVRMTNDLGYRYGTFVIRARLSKGNHLLPSIYLLPAYQDHDNCKYEEVDIAQGRGQRTSTVIVGAYYGRQWNHTSSRKTEKAIRNTDFSAEFHEFALVWKQYRMEWFVDGRLIYTVPMYYYSDWLLEDESNLPCNMNKKLFQQELQLNFGLSVGGTMFPEAAYGDLTLENAKNWTKPSLEIDWVKIYDH